jgi:hypothetical protein
MAKYLIKGSYTAEGTKALLTPEELDAACKKSANYRQPGA